jgi:hypothetical protein
MKKQLIYMFVAAMLFSLGIFSCKHIQYNQTGAGGRTLNDSVTVSVMLFTNSAPLAKPSLAQTMTESLRDFIQRQTRFTMLPSGGDLNYEGDIVGYSVAPVAITGGATDQASLNRLTITVKVKYTDDIEDRYSFEGNFSRFADFPSTTDISAVEDQLIKEITDQITQDIINRSIYAW